MQEFERVGSHPWDARPDVTILSDAELTERIRSGAPTARPATQELRRRHLSSVLEYARLCGRNQVAGNQLAVQAFGIAAQEARRGIGPRGNWRHHLLLLVQRVGLTWASDSRRERLAPDFVAWIDDTAEARALADVTAADLPEQRRLPFEASAAMLTGFYRLPELARNVLWYSVVDEEPDASVATFLRVHRDVVPDVRRQAEGTMRLAFLQAYLERSRDERCLGFRRIIEAAARPGDRRRSEDLVLHLAECPRCSWLVDELTLMAEHPRMVLAEGLLRWGGTAYVSALLPHGSLRADSAARGTATGGRAPVEGPGPSRRVRGLRAVGPPLSRAVFLVGAAAAVASALVAGTLAATASEGPRPGPGRSAAPSPRTAHPTPSVATAPPSQSPSPSESPSSPAPTPTPTPTAVSRPSAGHSAGARPLPVPLLPGGGYAPVVNSGSGRCLDIENGLLQNRTDVIVARCTGARTQSWKVDPNGLVRSGADPDYCLDSRGNVDRGAGIWNCSSVNGRNGLNLLFTVDGSGAVRPRIAPDFALAPSGGSDGSSVGFDRADGSGAQRWTAGPSSD
ncbi:ricin-type beta-trefoil lectin domain protein [Streptomyces sp. NPDC059176]|uniref:ricin-type beta-trefoil lectin domain protein n=1 Tax=unclassified Streptomyces TaxID=2593676 RepID=UPI003698A7FC